MSRRYYKNKVSAKKVGIGIVAAVLGVATIVGCVMFAEPIKQGVNDVTNSITQSVGKTEKGEFDFSRAYLRYNKNNAGQEPRQINYEFEVSEELMRAVESDSSKRFATFGVKLSTYENLLRDNNTHEKAMDAYFRAVAESQELTVDEYLESAFNRNENFNPDRNFAVGGEVVNMLRVNYSFDDTSLNARQLVVAAVITEEDDGYSYQVSNLGGYNYNDLEVSPSLSYLASRYLNEMSRFSALYSAELEGYCQTLIQKSHLLVNGEDVSGYAGVELTVDTTTVYTMSVGQTKKLTVDYSTDTDVNVVFMEETYSYPQQAGAFEVSPTGIVKAYKAGTYKYVVCVYGVKYECTLVVEA